MMGPLARSRLVHVALAMVVGGVTSLATSASPAAAATPPFDYNDSATIDVQSTPTMVDLDGSGGSYSPDPRLWDVTVVSPSIFVAGSDPAPPPAVDPVQIPLNVRIYLPDGYDQDRSQPYPVLYLLHGGAGTWADWSAPGSGDITSTLDSTSFEGITVMVEGGRSGWYSDWQGETDGHFSPKWETFHLDMVDWVDANLNTIADDSGRAIAGLSMGGLGSMRYAAHHPDVFSAVGSFSGAVDMRYEPMQDTISNSMWFYGATVVDEGMLQTEYRVTPGGWPEQEETARMEILFGASAPPVPPETRPGWPSMNPTELAASGAFSSYDGKLAIYSGESVSWFDNGEEDIATMNDDLHAALAGSSVEHRYCKGFGTHSWSYWRNDLRDFVEHVYGSTPATCTTNSGWTEVP